MSYKKKRFLFFSYEYWLLINISYHPLQKRNLKEVGLKYFYFYDNYQNIEHVYKEM